MTTDAVFMQVIINNNIKFIAMAKINEKVPSEIDPSNSKTL